MILDMRDVCSKNYAESAPPASILFLSAKIAATCFKALLSAHQSVELLLQEGLKGGIPCNSAMSFHCTGGRVVKGARILRPGSSEGRRISSGGGGQCEMFANRRRHALTQKCEVISNLRGTVSPLESVGVNDTLEFTPCPVDF